MIPDHIKVTTIPNSFSQNVKMKKRSIGKPQEYPKRKNSHQQLQHLIQPRRTSIIPTKTHHICCCKYKSSNQIFEGIEKGSKFMQGEPNCQVSMHMTQEEALNAL